VTDCLSSKAAVKQFMACRELKSSSDGPWHSIEGLQMTFTIKLKNKSHVLSFRTPGDMIPQRVIRSSLFHVDGAVWDHYPTPAERLEAAHKRAEMQAPDARE
jgi:hypothetical protein